MRLGLTDRPMTYNDVLWPWQVPPQVPVKTEVSYSPGNGNVVMNENKNQKYDDQREDGHEATASELDMIAKEKNDLKDKDWVAYAEDEDSEECRQ